MTADNILVLITILSIITLISIIAIGTSMVYVYHIHKKELEKIMNYEINIEAKIDNEIPNILETYVVSIFTDYKLKFLEADESLIYINGEKEIQILHDIGDLCSKRLSPAMVDKLSLFWKREHIAEVISDKIYLVVMQYVASFNAVKDISNNQ